MNNMITVEVTINASVEKVWEYWNDPSSITQWAFASPDWEAPYAENDLKVGGRFLTRMSAKDKSASFDFTGVYTEIIPFQKIAYTIDDGRKVETIFEKASDTETNVVTTFEMEHENSEEKQREGWQAILSTFKKFVESHS